MSQKPSRHWFQFSLRTMFVLATAVVIFLAWLGWNVNLVRQRRAMLDLIPHSDYPHWAVRYYCNHDLDWPTRNEGFQYMVKLISSELAPMGYKQFEPSAPYRLSPLRRWLGDTRRSLIAYFPGPEHQRVRELFPEAVVVVADGPLSSKPTDRVRWRD